jgi:hypothetical protein
MNVFASHEIFYALPASLIVNFYILEEANSLQPNHHSPHFIFCISRHILFINLFLSPLLFFYLFIAVNCLKYVSAYMFIPGGKYNTQLNRYTTETVYESGCF